MMNTINKLIGVIALCLAVTVTAQSVDTNHVNRYDVVVSSGVANGVDRYGVLQLDEGSVTSAQVQVNGVKYIDTYYLGVDVNLPFQSEQSNLTVISTGFKKSLSENFSARIGVEYANRDSAQDDFNSGIRLAFEKYKLIQPYVGYSYDFNNDLHILEAGLPLRYSVKVPVLKVVHLNVVAAYGRYENEQLDVYQLARFGGGFEVPLGKLLSVYGQGSYFYGVENTNVALSDTWLGSAGLKLRF